MSFAQQQQQIAAEAHTTAVALINPTSRATPRRGSVHDRDAAPTEGRKRTGCWPAALGSSHMLKVEGKNQQLEVYSLALNPESAKGARVICLHPSCNGATYATEAELLKAHPKPETMARAEAGHPWALLSTFTSGEASAPVLLIREQE